MERDRKIAFESSPVRRILTGMDRPRARGVGQIGKISARFTVFAAESSPRCVEEVVVIIECLRRSGRSAMCALLIGEMPEP